MVDWRYGTSALGICAFCYVLNLFWCCGIPYIYGQFGGWGIHLPYVYVHSAICETFLVQLYSIHLWSIWRGGSICNKYMCTLLYVKHIWCSGIP